MTRRKRELFISKSSERFIGLPMVVLFILLAILGGKFTPPIQGIIWTTGFLLIASRCLWHGWHCGRIECIVTGPLFAVLGVFSALHTLGLATPSWNTIWNICYAGVSVAFVGGFLLSSKLGTRYLKKSHHFDKKSTIVVWGIVISIVILIGIVFSGN